MTDRKRSFSSFHAVIVFFLLLMLHPIQSHGGGIRVKIPNHGHVQTRILDKARNPWFIMELKLCSMHETHKLQSHLYFPTEQHLSCSHRHTRSTSSSRRGPQTERICWQERTIVVEPLAETRWLASRRLNSTVSMLAYMHMHINTYSYR